MRIIISGTPGSGKSTVAKLVATQLKLKYYCIGNLQRRYAKERKVSITELMKIEENYPLIDREVDELQRELGQKEDNFVLDSRLGAFFIPHATLKVFLDARPEVRAERIWKDRRPDDKAESAKVMLTEMEKRDASDEKRYKALYETSYRDPQLYNRTIDTSDLSPEAVAKQITEWAQDAEGAKKK